MMYETIDLLPVDHSHNHFCVTTPEENPVELMLNETLQVTSIFARTKGKRDRSDPGTNSPMLYVIKGMHELTTTPHDIALLCASFRQILPAYVAKGFEWDWIVPLPSCSRVCFRLADKVQRQTQRGICDLNALPKLTAGQVLANLNEQRISSRDKTRVRNDIKRFHRHSRRRCQL
jgi:hypothetical protein